MGACCCCCATKQDEPANSLPFYHYPRVPEERQPLSPHQSGPTVHSTTLLVDTNLDTSIPDTYRPPPSPLPYETFVGPTQTLQESSSLDTTVKDNEKVNSEEEVEFDEEVDLKKSTQNKVSNIVEEEDCCPTCLEEYDEENPKIMTKCEHHFHLACILEWMERSETCAVCNQEMVFDSPIDG